MIGERREIRGTLVALTPLRIASGEMKKKGSDGPQGSKEDENYTIAKVVQTKGEQPYIPGSSLKGIVRRLALGAEGLLGPEKEKGGGASGTAIFWDAFLSKRSAEKGNWIGEQRRTQIDDASGTAEAGRLFSEEYVRPGAEFDLEIFLAAGCPEADEDALKSVLSQMMSRGGVAIGADTRQGLGYVRLLPDSLLVQHWSPSKGHNRLNWPLTPSEPVRAGARFPLRLSCDGAFLISEGAEDRRPERGDAERNNVITALRTADGKVPELTGSTVIGALRAAFEWYVATSPQAETAPATPQPPQDLTDRLFGTADWRGRVVIDRLTPVGQARSQKIPSVKLDRFSGAPMDNALFFTEAWTNVAFDLDLRLERRGEATHDAQFDRDDACFKTFVEGLSDDTWGGLHLGHGENSGYGWFSVKQATEHGVRT